MDWILNIAGFVAFIALLYWAGELLINNLTKLSKFLGLKSFVVAFFVMAFAASLGSLFVGIGAALQGIPELSLGDVFGNNITAMTLAVAMAVFLSPSKNIKAHGDTIRLTVFVTVATALLPLLLLANGTLSSTDGIILIGAFFLYIFWLFSKKNRFRRKYHSQTGNEDKSPVLDISASLRSAVLSILGIVILLIAAQGIVSTATFFASELDIPLVVVGLLIVGFGNALPEVYFAMASARRGETQMILGNVMGAVIFPSTLVLGTVALIHPITISELSFFITSRLFLILASASFLFSVKSKDGIRVWEATALLLIYIGFLLSIMWLAQ